MDRIGEACGMLHAVQVCRRRASDGRSNRQLERHRAAGQLVIAIETSIGVDVPPKPYPGGTAKLMSSEQASVDGV
ncbi:hypothetical protein [Micromonospora qiuiae]|uniref:hypothetical protein n=1 Tax=Micromonospora qiuiae TaxID=502268 RepID=UPI001EF16A87|nr:hypothetical protein [Micromonospora qiuiae]